MRKPKKSDGGYIQQLHRDCGGVLVAVARPNQVAFACRKCLVAWEIQAPIVGFGCQVPADWIDGVIRNEERPQ